MHRIPRHVRQHDLMRNVLSKLIVAWSVSAVLLSCSQDRPIEFERGLTIVEDDPALVVERLPELADPYFDWIAYAPDGQLAMSSHVGGGAHGADVYEIDPLNGEVSDSGLIADGESLAEATFTISPRYVTAKIYICQGGIKEGDAGYLCRDHEAGHFELHVLTRETGEWSELDIPNSGNGIHFEHIDDVLYFGDLGSAGTSLAISSLQLPDGPLTAEPGLKINSLDQIFDALGTTDPDSSDPVTQRNVTSGLSVSFLEDRSLLDGQVLIVSSDSAQVSLRYVARVEPTETGVYVIDEAGDRYLVTAANSKQR